MYKMINDIASREMSAHFQKKKNIHRAREGEAMHKY